MSALAFTLWAGLAVHQPSYDDAGVDNRVAGSVEARLQVGGRVEVSVTHKSIIEKKDTGETYLEGKIRLW